MLRTQISLTEDERRVLSSASLRTGRSISALIREAVDATFGTEHSIDDDLDAIRRSGGSWSSRGLDGATWVEGIRSAGRLNDTGR